jgi:hypothetical protein
MTAYDPCVAPRTIIVLDAGGIDDAVLAAAGLRPGQTVVAEATEAGLLLRAAREEDLAAAAHVTVAEATSIVRRYPSTIARLGR